MAYGEETFTHQRVTRTGDGAGGKVETPVTIGTIVGRKHFYQRQSQQQLEREDAPARAVSNKEFVAFDDPTVGVVKDDFLIDEAGAAWRVLHVRIYDFQCQTDVELVA